VPSASTGMGAVSRTGLAATAKTPSCGTHL
jgi:hypothetical protein